MEETEDYSNTDAIPIPLAEFKGKKFLMSLPKKNGASGIIEEDAGCKGKTFLGYRTFGKLMHLLKQKRIMR